MNYTIKVKAKISNNMWSPYSSLKTFRTKKKPSFKLDSVIVTDKNELKKLKQLLLSQLTNYNDNTLKLKLLYRSTRDGNTVKKFHEFCDNKGPTLTLIHSEFNHVFGGYTNVSWIFCF